MKNETTKINGPKYTEAEKRARVIKHYGCADVVVIVLGGRRHYVPVY